MNHNESRKEIETGTHAEPLTARTALDALDTLGTVYAPDGTPCVVTAVLASARGVWVSIRAVDPHALIEIERSPVAEFEHGWANVPATRLTRRVVTA